MPKTHKTLLECVQSNNVKKFVRDVHHYLSIGYYVSGTIHSATRIVKLFPLRLETEYTVFLTKVLSFGNEEEDES